MPEPSKSNTEKLSFLARLSRKQVAEIHPNLPDYLNKLYAELPDRYYNECFLQTSVEVPRDLTHNRSLGASFFQLVKEIGEREKRRYEDDKLRLDQISEGVEEEEEGKEDTSDRGHQTYTSTPFTEREKRRGVTPGNNSEVSFSLPHMSSIGLPDQNFMSTFEQQS